MKLTEKTKTRIGIYALFVFTASLLFYSGLVVAEFYTSKYGQVVNAKVVDVSDICRLKNKYITLIVDGNVERLKIYGLRCRQADFPLNSIVKVRKFYALNIVTIPENYSTIRVIIFPLLTIVASVGLMATSRHKKKKMQVSA